MLFHFREMHDDEDDEDDQHDTIYDASLALLLPHLNRLTVG